MRKLGINLHCYGLELPIEEQVALMKANGFERTFCVSSGENFEENFKIVDKAGITFDNLHAPFRKINDIWHPGEDGDAMLASLIDGAEKCSTHGIPAMVVHLSSGLTPPYVNETGHDRFARLMEYAAKNNVTICYENQRMLSNLAFAFEEFKDQPRFCWDCGHEFCFTPGRHYMPIFGDKLAALHIHDNRAIFNKDDHMIPFDANIDFSYVSKQIALSKYEGTLMLEVIRHSSDYYTDWSAEKYYAHAAEAARKLAGMIDKAAEEL